MLKGQSALLLSFKKYFRRYLAILFFLSFSIVALSMRDSLIDNMVSQYKYWNEACQKTDVLVTFPSNKVTEQALRSRIESLFDSSSDKELVSIEYVYPGLDIIFTNTSNTEYFYAKALPSSKLKGDELLILERDFIDDCYEFVLLAKNQKYSFTPITNDEFAKEENIGIWEVLLSKELYNELYSELHGAKTPYEVNGSLGIEYSGGADFKVIAEGLFYDNEINKLLEKSNADLYVKTANSYGVIDHYHYNSVAKRLSLFRRNNIDHQFAAETVNYFDYFNTPTWYLREILYFVIAGGIISSLLISISVCENRKQEFRLYSHLGMSDRRILKLVLIEQALMAIFVVAVSLISIGILKIVLMFAAPRGVEVASNLNLYFRDIYTMSGVYSTDGILLYWGKYLILFMSFFVISTSIINIMFIKKWRKEK